ncbi:hypothetical protein [Photobacterium kishitanii]|uniref:Uncharacterized protein n=1 Tax=Photobacterium kishitanii TaxID=318456 RepID=A0A2T3KM25_9GAMM|nr:hypothetical protein [Photobacterium kishitanii]PSV00729.1 hypothetical protein C9J27_06195 [Photobacterium kishitanii]
MTIFKTITKLFLSKEAIELGESLCKSNIHSAEVVGRRTIVVDAREIARSPEFKKLQQEASKYIRSNRP